MSSLRLLGCIWLASATVSLNIFGVAPQSAFAAIKKVEVLTWMFEKRTTSPLLVYGIPESDGAQFVATCQSSSHIVVQAASDVAGLSNDDEVDLGFRGDRFVHSAHGKVIGIDAENGITGTEFVLGADDAFWPGLIKQGRVKYGVPGSQPATLTLSDDRQQILDFLDACRTPTKVASTEADGDSCTRFGKIKSKNSKTPVKITFINKTDSFRAVMWLDFKGQPQQYANLDPGQKTTINTFVTHPWMFTDGPGNCQEIYLPKAGDTKFNITKSVASTGSE